MKNKYVTFDTSNGEAFLSPRQVIYVEKNSLNTEVNVYLKGGKILYVKDSLEEVLIKVYNNHK